MPVIPQHTFTPQSLAHLKYTLSEVHSWDAPSFNPTTNEYSLFIGFRRTEFDKIPHPVLNFCRLRKSCCLWAVYQIIHTTLLRKFTHNNCVPEPRTVLRVCRKWSVSDIRKRQGQPLTNCKYKSKLFIAGERKTFGMRNKSNRILISHFNLITCLHNNKPHVLNLLFGQAAELGAQQNIRLSSSLQQSRPNLGKIDYWSRHSICK